MIRLAYTYWIVKVLFGHAFPKTRRAIKAAQKRVKLSKQIAGARTW